MEDARMQEMEAVLLEYIERYGLTERARKLFLAVVQSHCERLRSCPLDQRGIVDD